MNDGAKPTQSKSEARAAIARQLRWQRIAIEQLSVAINVYLTLATAALGLIANSLMDSSKVATIAHSFQFRAAVLSLLVSVWAGLAANFTRANDMRYTRRIVHLAHQGGESVGKLRAKVACLGRWTWRFFTMQAIGLGVAVLLGALFLMRGKA